MIWPLILLIGTPFVIGLVGLLFQQRRSIEVLHCLQAGILVASTMLVGGEVASSGVLAGWGLLRMDALSAWFVSIIGLVASTGTLYAVGYLGEQMDRGHISFTKVRHFFVFFDVYLGGMLLALTVESLGIMWIAVEGATLSAALLIGFERSPRALEAGWKFVILSSVGIALALFGTILVYYASEQLLGVTETALNWADVHRVGDKLDPGTMSLAFLFALIGYGTKAGLAPMHTWLPDAHGEAPTPVSAMLSANMLTMAVYAILRFKILVDQAVGPWFSNSLLIGFGLASVGLASVFLLLQQDYKRLFAYSSIEHIGIALVGFGLGGIGVFGGLWHLLHHALAKSSAFYGAGLVLLHHDHKLIERAPGLLKSLPLAGGTLLVAGLALAGMPPFSLFVSEVAIATEAFTTSPTVAYGFLGMLTLAFATLLYQVLRMVLGEPVESNRPPMSSRARGFVATAIGVNLVALAYLSLQIPEGLSAVLQATIVLLGTGEETL